MDVSPERARAVGAKYNVPWQKIDLKTPLVSRVRTSQFQVEPVSISRVVLDLNKEVDYKTWAEGNMQIIEIAERAPAGYSSDVRESTNLLQPLNEPEVAKSGNAARSEPPAQAPSGKAPVTQASMGPFLPYLPVLNVPESAKAPVKEAQPAVQVSEPAEPKPAVNNELRAEVPPQATSPAGAEVVPAASAPSEAAKIAETVVAAVPQVQSAPQPSNLVKEQPSETKAAEAVAVAPTAQKPVETPPAAPPKVQESKPVEAKAQEAETQETESPWLSAAESSDEETSPADEVSKDTAKKSTYGADREQTLSWSGSYARGNPAAGGGAGMGSQRITIDAQGADIKTVLRTVSDYSGKNIVYGPDVKGEVYIHIKDVPWEEALDIILRAHGYGYREEYGMIRVAQLDRLMKEEIELSGAERKKDELMPLVTRIIFVNNSNAEELKSALQNIVSDRGKLDVDKGSNALIVNDTEPVIEKIGEMVKSLDKKTFQVDINAKLVEVDVEATRELGINWGLLNLHASGFGGVGSAEVKSEVATSAGTVKFGTVRSWGELSAVLDVLERTNKANIISNPRITTMDNREASILVGKEIPLIVADEAGNPITELTKIGIMLKVTPHVNSDKTITLDMHPEVSELQGESTAQGGVIISTSEADTRVVVNNGNTAVIGGLIKNVQTSERRGVPVLKDIPFLGRLFSSNSKADKKQELVIFVTPTIVE